MPRGKYDASHTCSPLPPPYPKDTASPRSHKANHCGRGSRHANILKNRYLSAKLQAAQTFRLDFSHDIFLSGGPTKLKHEANSEEDETTEAGN